MALAIGTNSWLSVDDANTYFATRLGASAFWNSAADKDAALVTAYYDLATSRNLNLPSAATVMMKNAQCEQAFFRLAHEGGVIRRMGLRVQGVTKSDAAGERYNFKDIPKVAVCVEAMAYLQEYRVAGALHLLDLSSDEGLDVDGN